MKVIKGIIFLLMFMVSAFTYGNHVLGGNLSYECLGGTTYGITLTYYKDCFGATAEPDFELLSFEPNSTTCISLSANMDLVSVTEISDLCPSELANNSCNGGFTPGTLEVIYYLEIDLDPACIWTISWFSGDWNYFINVDNSMLPTAYMELIIDPSLPCEETPQVTSLAVPYYCTEDVVSYTPTFDNPNGYTFEYYLTPALTTGGASVPYQGGYTFDEPIPGLTVDALTGEINFVAPVIFGNYIVGIEVQMFDLSGAYVGSFFEYMTFVVRQCGSLTEFDTDTVLNPHPDMIFVDQNEYNICAGDSLCFDLEADNTNIFRSVTISSDYLSTVFAGGTFNTIPDNPAEADFCIEVDGTMVGTHIIEFYAIDDACVQSSADTIQVIINVSPTVQSLFTDTLFCANTEITLDVFGDIDFQWDVLLPATDPGLVQGSASQTFTPAESMVIEVTGVNTEAYCPSTITFDLNVSLYDIDTTIVDESCLLFDGSIDVTPLGGSGVYTYSWDPPAATQDLAGLQGGDYTLTITDTDSPDLCSTTEIYTVEGVTIPTASIGGDVTLCEGECHDITFNLTGDGPFTVNLVNLQTGALELTGTLNDQDTYQVCPATTTTYELQLVSDSNLPACTDDTFSSVTVTVMPTVSAIFEEPDDVCAGSTGELVFEIDQPGIYDVSTSIGDFAVSDGDILTDVDVPGDPTVFSINSISYQGAMTCTNSTESSVDMAQIALPTAFLSGDTTICFEDLSADFSLELTGVGPWLIDYDIIGSQTASVTDFAVDEPLFDFPIGITSVPTTQQYCIVNVYDVGTTCSQDLNSCATVVIEPLPTVNYLDFNNFNICPGEEVGPLIGIIEPDFDSNGDPYSYDVILQIFPESGGVIDSTIQDINAFVLNFAPEETTTYQFINIVDSTGTAFCSSPIDETIVINVYDLPETVTPIDTVCGPSGEFYTYTFEITGGDETNYNIEGQFFDINGLGTLVGNTYTSEPIPSGFGESWTINDGDPCPEIVETISAYTCPIITYSGTLDLDVTAEGICEDEVFCVVQQGDEVLDPNDVLSFAILDDPDPNFANVLFLQDSNCWDLTAIGFPPLEYNVEYYAVAVAGNDDGTGVVDLTNPNIYFSEVDTFSIYEIPTSTVTGGAIVCEGDTATVQVQLTGVGPWNFDIMLDGILDSTVTSFEDDIFYYDVVAGMDYTTTSLNNEFCATGANSGTGIVLVNPIPTGTITVDGEICEGETYDFDLAFTGSAEYNVVLTYEDEDGDLTDIDLPADIPDDFTVYTASDAGQYYITQITDGNGCVSTDTSEAVTLVVYDLPTLETLFTDTSFCTGQIIDLEVALTGEPDFSLDYDFDGNPPINVISANDTINLAIGNAGSLNLLTLTDGNNCVIDLTGSTPILIEELDTPTADAGPDIIVCSDVDQLIGTLEDPLFVYEWTGNTDIINDDTIAQPTVNYENTVEGIDDLYNLTLTVSNGQCADTDDIMVTIQWEPIIDAGDDANICNGEIYQLNGVGGVSCLWDADPSFIDLNDICAPNVAPTDTTMYYLTVTGANGCLNNDSIQVFVPEALTFVADFDDEVCFMTCDGDIEITPSGGFGAYTINWVDLTLTDLTESDLCAGVYDFTVFDDNLCSIDGSVEIIGLAEYFLDDVLLTPSTCFDGSNGQIQVVSGTAVEYFIDIPDTNATGIFNGLPIGMYGIGAIDDVGCIATDMVDLTSDSEEILFNTSITDVVVCYEEPTDITGEALGGDDNFTYSWYDCFPTPPCFIESAVTTTIIPEEDVQIWAVAIDGNGCSSDTLLVEINLAPEIFIDSEIESEVEICQGECVVLEALASGGDGSPIITWEQVDPNLVLGSDPSYTECPLEDVSYMAIGTDGCSAPTEYLVQVTVFETAVVEIFIDGEDGCYPVTVQFENLTDPDLLYLCEWDFGDGNTQPICTEIEYTYASPGIYNPTLTVTTENGCTSVGTTEEPISVYDYPQINFFWTPEYVSTINNEVQFVNFTTNAQYYNWDIGGLFESVEIQPNVMMPLTDETNYEICLEATSSQGCIDTLCQNLFINGELLVYIPNAFTPDFDGVNDVFKPIVRGIDPNNYVFRIFDRWDNILFETTDPEGYWIGDNKDGEHFVDHDVYVYQIIVRELGTDEEFEYRGHITILR